MQQTGPSNGSSTPGVPATPSDMFPYVLHSIPSNAMGPRNVVDPRSFLNGGPIRSARANPHDITTISHSFNDIHHSVHRVSLYHADNQEAVGFRPHHVGTDDVGSSSFLGPYVAPTPGPLQQSNTALAIPPMGNEQVQAPVPSITVEALPALGNFQTLQDISDLRGMDERIQGGTLSDGYKCRWEGCRYDRSFSRQADLLRHVKTVHIYPHSYTCPAEGCNRTFNRKDNLSVHFHRLHRGMSS